MSVVRIRPSSYLSVPRFALIDAMMQTLPRHEVDDWVTFTRSMTFVVSCSYSSVIEAMRKHAWEESRMPIDRREHRLLSQLQYLKRLMSLVSAAQYTPLNESHWEFGVLSQETTSGQHVHIDMSQHENELFSKFFETHPYWFGPDCEGMEDQPHPEFSSKILIFFRGTTVIKKKGFFLQDKLRFLLRSLLYALRAIARLLRLPWWLGGRSKGDSYMHEMEMDTGYRGQSRFGAQKIERVTLESYFRQHGLRALVRTITLQEPAFSNLIVIYPNPKRRHIPAHSPTDKSDEGSESPQLQSSLSLQKVPSLLRRVWGPRPDAPEEPEVLDMKEDDDDGEDRENRELSSVISVEAYQCIPFRDLGLVVPGREVKMGVRHRLRFTMELLMSLIVTVACIVSLQSSSVRHNILLVVFLIVGVARIATVLQSLSDIQAKITSDVNDWLDQHRVAKDNPFVARLVNQVEEQELKEILLGYFFLWKKGSLTKRQLDYEVETFLNEQFQLELDFEVEDALQKLIVLRLVDEVGGKYHCAMKPKDYLDDPYPRWLDFFHSFATDECFTSVHTAHSPPSHTHQQGGKKQQLVPPPALRRRPKSLSGTYGESSALSGTTRTDASSETLQQTRFSDGQPQRRLNASLRMP